MLAIQIFLGLSVFIVAVFVYVAWSERKQYRELYTNFEMEPYLKPAGQIVVHNKMDTAPINDAATVCGGCFKQRTPDEMANCAGENCVHFITFSPTVAVDTSAEMSDKS